MSPREKHDRQLAQAKREIAALTYQRDALVSTIKTIDRLARPYAAKPEQQSRLLVRAFTSNK
jgi:hypothetical protein